MGRFDIFEYAGKSSSIYNLVSCEINKDYQNIISGAEYEPTVDTLPHSANQLLLGLDYSDKPLEFDLEIINPDENIPYTQVEEIKDWLFGQNGWKKFVIINERQDYYLRALLIPSEDIMDVNGYRGFRCKVRNDSGFWYRDENVDIPLTFQGDYDGAYQHIKKSIKLDFIPDRMEINPIVKFNTLPPRRVLRTATVQCATDGEITYTDSEYDSIESSYFLVYTSSDGDRIRGEYDSASGVFLATVSSNLVAGREYFIKYYVPVNMNSSSYWNEGGKFTLYFINTLNDSVLAFKGIQGQFSVSADCKYGTFTRTQNGTTENVNLLYPPYIDNTTKYSNLFYLSRGENKFKIFLNLWTADNGAAYVRNISDNIFVGNKITISFTSLHRIGGF